MPTVIALVGDRDPDVTAHRSIDACIALVGPDIEGRWVPSPEARDGVADADGIWCVPASPYVDTDAVLDAITHARVNRVPFLGTCGGYQHAIIEFARNVAGDSDATSAELAPDARRPLITALRCALRDTRDEVRTVPGTHLHAIWGTGPHAPEYNCGFGVDDRQLDGLTAAGLTVCAHDGDGAPRAVELPDRDFFLGVAFPPERAARRGTLSPIVSALFRAARNAGISGAG